MQDYDPFDLQRFVAAQQPVWTAVESELRAGAKRSHWMWFVFPQIDGLGRSPVARLYAISSRAGARAYLDHPLLGRRLRTATELAMRQADRPLLQIFGTPDDLKFRSSMTLFSQIAGNPSIFGQALAAWQLHPDPATLDLLGSD